MKKMGPTLCAGVLLAMMSGCPAQEISRVPDAYVAPFDAYVPPLPDAGPPPPATCTGVPHACNEQTSATCTDIAGCRLARCTGESSCDFLDRESCAYVRGCYYRDSTGCEGTPADCQSFTDGTTCRLARCNWDFDGRGRCIGTATPCSTLSGAACSAQPGCTSLLDAGMPDAGPPDAGNDAGPPDAGPPVLCSVGGTCDPFAARPCGGYLCIPDRTMRTRCTAPAFTLRAEGAACATDSECERGLACLSLAGVFQCRRLCRIGDTTCGADSVCGTAYDSANPCLRICQPRCDLYMQDCPAGQACVSFRPNAVDDFLIESCLPEGTTPIGGACMYADSCVRGGICLGSVCRQLCDAPTDCTSGACIAGSDGIFTCR